MTAAVAAAAKREERREKRACIGDSFVVRYRITTMESRQGGDVAAVRYSLVGHVVETAAGKYGFCWLLRA